MGRIKEQEFERSTGALSNGEAARELIAKALFENQEIKYAPGTPGHKLATEFLEAYKGWKEAGGTVFHKQLDWARAHLTELLALVGAWRGGDSPSAPPRDDAVVHGARLQHRPQSKVTDVLPVSFVAGQGEVRRVVLARRGEETVPVQLSRVRMPGTNKDIELETYAARAFRLMNEAYRAEFNRDLPVNFGNGFRSHERQQELYQRYVRGQSPIPANQPGKSNHELGLAIDFKLSDDSKALKWLLKHGKEFGYFQHPNRKERHHFDFKSDKLNEEMRARIYSEPSLPHDKTLAA